MNRDKYGIIGQIQRPGSKIKVEGGDSLTWMGHWLYLNDGVDPGGKTVTNTKQYIDFFEVAPGAFVRHPDPELTNNGFGAYYKNPYNGCITRDQLTGALAALIKGGHSDAMWRVIKHSMYRGMLFTYNTIKNGADPATADWQVPDIMFMDIWAMMIRGMGVWRWILYPLLVVLDLHMLINTIFTNFFDRKNNDQINQVVKLLVGIDYAPTPVSLLSWWLSDKALLLGALERYWTGWRDTPEFMSLYDRRLK